MAIKDNAKENSKYVPYEYTVVEKVLIVSKSYERNRKISSHTRGPYVIIKVNNNGTIVIERNKYYKTIIIRRILAFKESDQKDDE